MKSKVPGGAVNLEAMRDGSWVNADFLLLERNGAQQMY